LNRLGPVRSLVLANAVTSFGSSVTEFALPLIALTLLDASPTVVALLYAVSLAATAVVSVPAGVWIDRTDRKRAIIIGLVAGGLVVLAVPALTAAGQLSVAWLLAVAVGVGVTSTIVQVSAQALVPALTEGRDLVSANAGMTFGRSLGTMVGPGAGGAVVGWLGAGFALLVDGVSQLLSALLLVRLPNPEADRPAVSVRPRRAAREGVQAVLADRILRRILIGMTVFNVGGGLIGSLYFPFAYNDLGLTPIALGVAAMIGNVGLLVGSAVAPRVVGRLGLARAGTLFDTVAVASFCLILSAAFVAPLVMLAVYEFVFGSAISVFRVCMATLRQQRTPDALQGRVFSIVLMGPMFGAPTGAVLGAGLAALPLGVFGAIVVGVVISAVSLTPFWLPGWQSSGGDVGHRPASHAERQQ
jgi:MFS family permease